MQSSRKSRKSGLLITRCWSDVDSQVEAENAELETAFSKATANNEADAARLKGLQKELETALRLLEHRM